MDLSRSASLVPRLAILASSPSTNDELSREVAANPDDWPELSLIVTDDQTSGKGRLGRRWVAPAGSALAISFLVQPSRDGALSWIPLVTGLALTRSLRSLGADARLKWPNDVQIEGRKVAGILCELLAGAAGVVVGVGVNLSMTREQLPVDNATSLALEDVETDPDTVLSGFLHEFIRVYRSFSASGGDPEGSGLADAVRTTCATIGRSVRVHLPDGSTLTGTAVSIDKTGRLVVETDRGLTPVAAGDVTHLRY